MPRRLRRFVLYPLAAVIPAAGLMLGLTTTAGATTSTATPSATKAAAAKQAAIRQFKQLHIGQHGTAHKVGTAYKSAGAKGVKGLTQVQSNNWAGYADTGSNFSKVSVSYTEPTATCSSSADQLAAFWVGIDGYSSSTVEQDGTMIECYEGTAYHYTWWEMYPTNDVQVVGQTAAAGDSITATVTRSGSNYSLAVTDSTNSADSFSTTQTGSGDANSSAEWIAEAPSGSSSLYPLANFGTWTANNASMTEGSTSGSISSGTDDEITMVNDSGQDLTTTGALNSSGNSFSVKWDQSS